MRLLKYSQKSLKKTLNRLLVEEIRKRCTAKLKSLLKQETGQEIVREVLFTKYLYH